MDMQMPPNDLDRLLIFEHARRASEAHYAKDPLDADNLTKWGAALLELSQFQTAGEGVKMVKDGITRLEEALQVNPRKHDALWYVGNAYTSQAFMISDLEAAQDMFKKASQYFQQAAEEDPGNELYIKSLEVAAKAPELHKELQSQTFNKQGAAGGPSASHVRGSKNNKSSDLKYDIFGWVILAVGIVAWVGMAKSHLPPPPPM